MNTTEGFFLPRVKAAALDVMFAETTPPLKAALRRLGVSDGGRESIFPTLTVPLSSHYLEVRLEHQSLTKLKTRRLRTIVHELHLNGTFPSTNAVLDVFIPGR